MSSTQAESQTPTGNDASPRKAPGWLSMLTAVVALALLLVIIVPLFRHWRAEQRLNAAVATMERDELPDTLPQLLGDRTKQNRAEKFYVVAFREILVEKPPIRSYDYGDGVTRPQLLELEAWLQRRPNSVPDTVRETLASDWARLALRSADAATREPDSYFHMKDFAGALDPRGYLEPLNHIQTLLLTDAAVAGLDGDPDRCIRRLLAASWLSRQVADQPDFISLTHYEMLQQRAVTVIRHAATAPWITREQTVMLMVEMQAHMELDPMPMVLTGERIRTWDWQAASLLDRRALEIPDEEPVPINWRELGQAKAELADWLPLALELETAARETAIDDRAAIIRDHLAATPTPQLAIGALLYRHNAGVALNATELTRSRAALTRAGLAVLLYRRLHGALPLSLSSLAPAIVDQMPTDPVAGVPILYDVQHDRVQLATGKPESPLTWTILAVPVDQP